MTRLLYAPAALVRLVLLSVLLALGRIWANKTRSALTMIGIIIGVASVTAVIAALTGLRDKVLSDFSTFGTNKIYIFPRRPETGRMLRAGWRQLRLVPEQFEGLLDHCPSVASFTRIARFYPETISLGEKQVESGMIIGIDPAWHGIESRAVIQGRPFSLIDEVQARPVCLITAKLRDKLALPKDCVGESIFVSGRRYVITGLVEPPAEMSILPVSDGSSDWEVLMPFSTIWKQRTGGMYAIAASRSPEVSEDARAELSFFLRRQRHLRPEDPDNFGMEVLEKAIQVFNSVASGITVVAGGVVGISLLVGGVGIMNIMLVSVSERTREIGLRKAVGARPSAILLQFLIEAVTICLVGGLIGLLAGYGLTAGLAKIPNAQLDKAYIPFWAILLSFGFATMVGLVFGMFPAIKAARLDPIEALRHE